MRFYGLLDHEIAQVVEFYTTEANAHRVLAVLLDDEPDWIGKFEIVEVDFGGSEVEVHPIVRQLRR